MMKKMNFQIDRTVSIRNTIAFLNRTKDILTMQVNGKMKSLMKKCVYANVHLIYANLDGNRVRACLMLQR